MTKIVTQVVDIDSEDSSIMYWTCTPKFLTYLFNFSEEKWYPNSHWLGLF